jgi:hypothetical protein
MDHWIVACTSSSRTAPAHIRFTPVWGRWGSSLDEEEVDNDGDIPFITSCPTLIGHRRTFQKVI